MITLSEAESKPELSTVKVQVGDRSGDAHVIGMEMHEQNPILRILQRYFVPRWIVSVYYFFKYQCLISTRTQVQFSNRISFGKGTVVKPFAVIKTQTGRITFGEDCAISSFNYITAGTRDIVVGNHVRIGPTVTILGTTRNFKEQNELIVNQGHIDLDVVIGDDVLIGSNAVILPGSRIGTGAVIGAMSVVKGEVSPYSIVSGIPAKEVGKRY